jgi:hypothetical protein
VTRLLTLGHGTATAQEVAALLAGAGVERLVDVRTAPADLHSGVFGGGVTNPGIALAKMLSAIRAP